MLRDLRDDWRALLARAEAETTELNRMEGYARIVTGVQALAAGLDLPPEMQAFVDEVRQRDARMVEGRRDELAFVQKAEAHCHRHPLLKWAAEERGLPVSELPEHAAWLAEGAALEETGRRMQETPGFVGRIAAALGRIAQGFRLDEGERFREAAARHEAEAQRLGIDPGGMAGAARLVQRAEALGRHELPEAVRRTVEAWTPEPEPPAPERVHRLRPDHEEAGRRIEAFLRDCRHCLDAAAPGTQALDRGSTRLRRFAARGCGCSARARERSSTIRHASGCPAPPTNANGCARPWTRLGRRCRGSARGRSWNSAGASPGRALKHAPIRSTCRHGGLCGIAPRRSGARRGLHRTRGRRSMRCSPAMPAWRPRSLPSELSSKRAPCTWIGARRWTKGFAASTPRPRMRSRPGGNARRAFARPP